MCKYRLTFLAQGAFLDVWIWLLKTIRSTEGIKKKNRSS